METTGDKMNSLAGRIALRLKKSLGDSPMSNLERSSSLPVSLRNFSVFLSRITGPKLSLMTKSMTIVINPLMMARTQKFHRQPFALERKPPAMGPTIGPRRGPTLYTAKTVPRCFCGIISAIVPPPFVIGATPNSPARNRKAMRELRLGASAQATWKATKPTLQAW
ncbi:hypothetical protein RRF57_012553 [Xylaria bambusicola]|uniref:Uncharacterized protein n=1 Tax=Xylaria bambusicola TaxID=326684 RepID=A0AAN7V1V8_9PEZI